VAKTNLIRQLYKPTDERCTINHFASKTGNGKQSSPKVPVMFYPDGTVCWPVNFYLVNKYKSIRIKVGARGGSIGSYASNLSHIVRFVFRKKINFEDLNDDYIFEFSHYLMHEKDVNYSNETRRNTSQVGRIIRKTLNFIKWYQDNCMLDESLIGECGCNAQITISYKEGTKNGYKFTYIHHESIPFESVPEDIRAIANHLITLLYDGAAKSTRNLYVRMRRQNMLRLFECTGARRIEISKIKISDIEEAFKTGRLKIYTAKHKTEDEFRNPPVEKMWISPILQFINGARKKLVQTLIEKNIISEDPGFLFLGMYGIQLSEETLTREISLCRNLAGIGEKTCSKMFRHRFITLQVVRRLLDYKGQRLPDQLAEVILTKVCSLTGHRHWKSLWPYMDLALDELGVWDTSEKALCLRSNLEGALRKIQTLKNNFDIMGLDGQEQIQETENELNNILREIYSLEGLRSEVVK